MYTIGRSMGAFWDVINPITYIMEVVNLIPKLVYFLTATAMSLLDMLQLVIRKVAGLDVYYTADGAAQTGDLALSFIGGIFGSNPNYTTLRNAFWAIIILSVILLFVTTIIATIRQEYMPGQEEAKEKPSNTKTHVVNRAIKSLFMFLIVPVSVFFGLMFSDAILRAMDLATSGVSTSSIITSEKGTPSKDAQGNDVIIYAIDRFQGETLASGQVTYINYDIFGMAIPTSGMPFSGFGFKIAGFSANRVRIDNTYNVGSVSKSFSDLVNDNDVSNFSVFNMAETDEDMAQMIDDAFAGNMKLQNPQELNYSSSATKGLVGKLVFGKVFKVDRFSKYNVSLVWYYYDLWQYNFVVGIAFLIVALKVMFKVVMGLMKRIIEMVALFIISPPIIALMPLDSGKAFGQWRTSFLGKALGVYGAIIGMNLLFLMLPYINQIKFLREVPAFSVGNITVYEHAAKSVNLIISTMFIIVGLVVVDGLIAMMSSIIGADDVAKEGGEISKGVAETLDQSISATALATGAAGKIAVAPFRMARDGINLAGSKATGDKDFKMGEAILRNIRPFMSEEKRDRLENEFATDWQEGGVGEASYNDYLGEQEGYDDFMNQRMDADYQMYKDLEGGDLSKEDWTASEGGQASMQSARDNFAETAQGLQSKEDFIRGDTGAGREAFDKSFERKLGDDHSLHTSLTRAKGSVKNRGERLALKVADSKIASIYANLSQITKQASGRKESPDMSKILVSGLQGRTLKDMSKQKQASDLREQEGWKARAGAGRGTDPINSERARELMAEESRRIRREYEEEIRKRLTEYDENQARAIDNRVSRLEQESRNQKDNNRR